MASVNNLGAFDAAIFSKLLVTRLDQINIMLPHVNMDYTGDLAQGQGSTVYVRTLGDVSMSDYNRGDTISYQGLAPAREAFQVNAVKAFAFNVDDVDAAQNDINALNAYAERASVALNNTVEAKILSAYSRAHADNQITGAASAAIVLDKTNVYSNFVQAAKRLDDKNVPSVGRFAIIDTATKALIATSTDLIRSTSLGDTIVQTGTLGGGVRAPQYVGNIAGFETYWSAACPQDSGAKYLVFGDNKAICYAAQLVEVERIRLEVTFATALRGLLLHDIFVSAEASKRLATVKIAK